RTKYPSARLARPEARRRGLLRRRLARGRRRLPDWKEHTTAQAEDQHQRPPLRRNLPRPPHPWPQGHLQGLNHPLTRSCTMTTPKQNPSLIDAFNRAKADIASLADWLECELQKQDVSK